MEKDKFDGKKSFWVLIIILTILLSYGNWVKIYHLWQVYSNPETLNKSLVALRYFKVNYGWAATDLAMREVSNDGNKLEFIFDYVYNTPLISMRNDSKDKIKMIFDKDQVAGVEKINIIVYTLRQV